MRSYCSLITPPLPRIFLIWGKNDRRGKSKNSCNNIFDGMEWDWERAHLDGGDQRSSHSKMRVSPCCSVLTCKLSWCWSLSCSWGWLFNTEILLCGAILSLCKEVFDGFSYRQELQFWVIQYFPATVIFFVLGRPTYSSNFQRNLLSRGYEKITHYTKMQPWERVSKEG